MLTAGAKTGTANIRQRPCHHSTLGPIVPTLLRGTYLFDIVCDRPWLPFEYFGLHGFPSPELLPAGHPASRYFPFAALDKEFARDHVMRSLLGNGMHLKSIGTVFLWALARADFKEHGHSTTEQELPTYPTVVPAAASAPEFTETMMQSCMAGTSLSVGSSAAIGEVAAAPHSKSFSFTRSASGSAG